jgi:hypothetical protein
LAFAIASLPSALKFGQKTRTRPLSSGRSLASARVARQRQQRLLAVHLAGVDVGHGEDDEPAAARGLGGGGGGRVGEDDERQLAALVAGAELAEPHEH